MAGWAIFHLFTPNHSVSLLVLLLGLFDTLTTQNLNKAIERCIGSEEVGEKEEGDSLPGIKRMQKRKRMRLMTTLEEVKVNDWFLKD